MTVGKALQTGGALLGGYGLVAMPTGDGASNLDLHGQTLTTKLDGLLSQGLAPGGSFWDMSNPYWGPTRNALLGGAVLVVAPPLLSRIPGVRNLLRFRLWR